MERGNSAGLLLLATAAVAMPTALAQAAEPTNQELLDQVKNLQAKVDQLQARQNASDAARTEATVDSVLSDAHKHDNLLDVTGVTGGYVNGKFILQSDNGDFSLHPWFLSQFRNVTTGRDNFNHGDMDWQNGFEVHRLKLGFDGNVFGPNLTYLFLWNTSSSGGGLSLSEGWARYQFTNTPFALKAGQFKNPFNHEQLVVDQFQLAAERTLLTDLMANGEGFVKGASLIYDDGGPLRGQVAFTGGMTNFNTTFQDFPTNPANYGLAARVEYKLFGDWVDYNDFTARGTKHDLLVVGAGVDYTEAGDTAVLSYTADAQYETSYGLALYGAVLGRSGRHVLDGSLGGVGGFTGAASNHNVSDYGIELQASYVMDRNWEPFLRYEYINLDSHSIPSGTTKDTVHEITAGVNYYLYGHHAKFTADVSYLPNGSPVSDESSGVLANNGHSEWLFRGQFQLFL